MIKGLLLDSGDTVIGPKGGRWNPRFDFEEVLRRHWPDARPDQFADAFSAGNQFMSTYGRTPSRDLYHRVILHHLGVDDPPQALMDELDAPLPPGDLVEVFPDVFPTLDKLRTGGVRMVVVSDAWSGLDRVYERLGLRDYFEAFVISEELGCRKPDARMYHAGSDALGLDPADYVFVDDDPELVAAALDLGYRGVALDRHGADSSRSDVATIASLVGLLPIFGYDAAT